MGRLRNKGFIFGLVLFGLCLILGILFEFKSPTAETKVSFIGLAFFVLVLFLLLISEDVSIFTILGFFFTFTSYITVFFFWTLYPHFAIKIFPIAVGLSVVFFSIAIFNALKK